METPGHVDIDLLAVTVPAARARAWGLDGLPPGEEPPAGISAQPGQVLAPDSFNALRNALLSCRETAVVARASLSTVSGRTTELRVADAVSCLEEIAAVVPPPSGSPEASPPREPTVLELYQGEPYDVGTTVEVTPSVSRRCGAGLLINLSLRISLSRERGSVIYCENPAMGNPLITETSLETDLECTPGDTLFVGSVFVDDDVMPPPHCRGADDRCTLLFVTPRFPEGTIVPDRKTHFEDGDTDTVLQILFIPDLPKEMGFRRRESSSSDWSDDDDDIGERREFTLGALREFLVTFGIGGEPTTKVLYEDPCLVWRGMASGADKVTRFFKSAGYGPIAMGRCTVAVAEIGRDAWDDIGRVGPGGCTDPELREILRRIAEDRGS